MYVADNSTTCEVWRDDLVHYVSIVQRGACDSVNCYIYSERKGVCVRERER